MDDASRFDDPQTFVNCPYNPAHTFPRFRMSKHINKCRKTHAEKSKEMKTCPFNTSHIVARIELPFHESVCPDRILLYNHINEISDTQNEIIEELNRNTAIELDIPATSSENWDDDIETERDIIGAVRQTAETRGVIQSNSNEIPSVRKALRQEQRARARERVNLEEERSRQPTEKSDDNESVISANSIGSGRSHNTFITARDRASLDLGSIPSEPSKENVNRGRGRPVPKQKSCEVGLGRGCKP